MEMERTLIMLPKPLKDRLKALRSQGYTASGFIRALLEKEFAGQPKPTKKGR